MVNKFILRVCVCVECSSNAEMEEKMNRHVRRFLSLAVVFMMCLSFASPVYANGKKIHYKIIFPSMNAE